MAENLGDAVLRLTVDSSGLNKGIASAKKSTDQFRDSMGRLRDANGRFVSESKKGFQQTSSSLNRSSESIKKFGNHLNTTAGKARQLGKSLAGVAAVTLGIGAAKSAITTTTQLAKTTKMLGDTYGFTKKQAASYAAASEVLEIPTTALAMGFTTLSRSSQAAANGGRKQAAAYRALGVSQEMLKHGNVNQIFERVAESLKQMPGGTKKAAIGMAIFGRGFQKMRPIIKGGSQGIKEIREQVEKYGAVITDEKGIKKYIASQHELHYAMLGLKVALGQQLIPTITKFVAFFTKFVGDAKAGVGVGGALRAMYSSLGTILANLFQWFQKNRAVAVILSAALAAMAAPVLAVGAAFLYAYDRIKPFRDAVNGVSSAVGNFVSLISNHAAPVIGESVTYIQNVFAKQLLPGVKKVVSELRKTLAVWGSWARSFWRGHGAQIMAIVRPVFSWIKTFIGNTLKAVQQIVIAVLRALRGDWRGAWHAIVAATKAAFANIKSIAKTLPSLLLSMLGKVIPAVAGFSEKLGKAIVEGIIIGIKWGASKIIDAVTDLGDKALQALKKKLHIASPSRVMRDQVGIPIAEGIAAGVRRGSRVAMQSISDLGLAMSDVHVTRNVMVSGNDRTQMPRSVEHRTTQTPMVQKSQNVVMNFRGDPDPWSASRQAAFALRSAGLVGM